MKEHRKCRKSRCWTVFMRSSIASASLACSSGFLAACTRLNSVADVDIPPNAIPQVQSRRTKRQFLGVEPRIFTPWPSDRTLPCFHPTDGNLTMEWRDKRNLKSPAHTGLLYLKLPKTASSTSASVHLRIARNLARDTDYKICKTRHLHSTASHLEFGKRDKKQSFLWSMIREPTLRYLSAFAHFKVSRENVTASDENVIRHLRKGPAHMRQLMIAWLSPRRYLYRKHRPYPHVKMILTEYDFLGISSRFDESLVVMMMLLNLKLGDILYVPSKVNGGYDDGQFQDRCVKIQKIDYSDHVKAFLESPEWQSYIRPEQELYRAANASLDLTIQALGAATVKKNLENFQRAQKVVQEKCRPRLPCNDKGERTEETDCLQDDMGCGFDCLDKVATELNLW